MAYAIVAARKLAEIALGAAEITGPLNALTKTSNFARKAMEVKTVAERTKDATEAIRADNDKKTKDTFDKGSQALLKLSEKTRDLADIVDSIFTMSGLTEAKPDRGLHTASDWMSNCSRHSKRCLLRFAMLKS